VVSKSRPEASCNGLAYPDYPLSPFDLEISAQAMELGDFL
jgi:hypothetical protein